MPVFNAMPYLAASVESVLSCGLPLELVAVDDGSTDGSSKVLARMAQADARITLLRHDANEGLVSSLLDGVVASAAPLIARLDADDVCRSGRLEHQYAAMLDDPDLVLCWTDYERIGLADEPLGIVRSPRSHEAAVLALSNGNAILHSSVMMRRSALDLVGTYSAEAYPAEDYDLWCRLLSVGRGRGLPIVGVGYRVNPAGISQRNIELQAEAAANVRQTQRQRLGRPGVEPRGVLRRLGDVRRRAGVAADEARRHSNATDEVYREAARQAFLVVAKLPKLVRWMMVISRLPRAMPVLLRGRGIARH
ncbi:MAG TPA: hypothetical protein DCR14_14890 [Acidimicrobiaceae bacterium]|nr:hypothetical protein [Acidimicrobiaceae bacterium]